MKCFHEEKGVKVNDLHNYKPDTECTCDVGVTGPAGDEELIANGSGAFDHPQAAPASGPSIDLELTSKGSGAFDHPQTIPASGPAIDPKLVSNGSGGYTHPQTPEATGPAKK